MSKRKWIQITTEIFDDERIKIIERMPAGDEILMIWFKLLVLAGKSTQSEILLLSEIVPYNSEKLAVVFNREEALIRVALSVFEKHGMVKIEDNQTIKLEGAMVRNVG